MKEDGILRWEKESEGLEWAVRAQEGKAGHPCRGTGSDKDGRLVTHRGTDHLVNIIKIIKAWFLTVKRGALQNKKQRKLE